MPGRWAYRTVLGSAVAGCAAMALAAYGCGTSRPAALGSVIHADSGTSALAPCEEGAQQDCHIPLGTNGSVVSCLDGVRTCNADGTWSACAGSSTNAAVVRGFRFDSLFLSPDAGSCNSACDPTCEVFTNEGGTGAAQEAGVLEGGAITATWFGIVFGPGGAVNPTSARSGMNDCAWNSTPCQNYAYGHWAACQFDTYCNPGACSADASASGSCLQYTGGQTVPVGNGGCRGPDLTLGVGCVVPADAGAEAGAGLFQQPICNRGTTSVPRGTVITFAATTGSQLAAPPVASPCTPQPVTCAMALTSDLLPGTCTGITQNTPGAGGYPACGTRWITNGQVNLVVNADLSVPECVLPDGGYPPNALGKAGCDDNATNEHQSATCQVITAVVGYAPATVTEEYVASCPTGTRVQWQYLAYNTTLPSNGSGSTSVDFQVATAPLQADGGPGTFTSQYTVANPGVSLLDPANCPLTGPWPCPKNLYTILGGAPAANNQVLNLTVTLTPSPDSQLFPSANSWQLTYSCPPSE